MSRDFSVDVPLLTVHDKPDDVAEGVNQLLYGEGVSILSDNGFCHISSELSDYIQDKGISHLRRRPNPNIPKRKGR